MNIVMTKLGNIEGIMSAFIPKVKNLNSLFSKTPSETALPLKAASDGLMQRQTQTAPPKGIIFAKAYAIKTQNR